jgi:hypothetical protein
MQVPQVQIANLRPLNSHNTADVPGADGPRFACADRHHELLFQRPSSDLATQATIETGIYRKR